MHKVGGLWKWREKLVNPAFGPGYPPHRCNFSWL
jgi:hypothetical protein